MELLEKHFDTAFSAPDGIKKLRELILTLAMQGKLVPQGSNDQPASELLKEIEVEKQKLIKEKKIKKQKELAPIKPDEVPYELPDSWEWVRLGNIANIIGGFAYKSTLFKTSGENQVLRLGNIRPDYFRLDSNPVFIDNDLSCKTKDYLLKINDIIITMTGTRAKRDYLYTIRVTQNPIDGVSLFLNQRLGIIRPYFDSIFVNNTLKVEIVIKPIFLSATGSANQANIGINTLLNCLIPLPPLSEQKRIVEKIDQLMAMCDEMEKLFEAKKGKRLDVHKSIIHQLLNAENKENFISAWDFIKEHFSELYSVKANVIELRKAILQLGMQGKLVPQDPNDQPASELLTEIEAEKQKLIKEKKIKKQKGLPSINPEEVPYELPDSWEWVNFGSIAQHNSGKTLDKSRNKGILRDYITTSNLYWGFFELNKIKQMPIKDEELVKCSAQKGDLLICEGGEAGRAAVWNFDYQICFQNHVHRAKFYCGIDSYFAFRFFEKLNATGEINSYRKGVGISNMSGKSLASIVIPLPPVYEQKRIVKKIDQLMRMCDDLDKQIDASEEKQTALLNSVMAMV